MKNHPPDPDVSRMGIKRSRWLRPLVVHAFSFSMLGCAAALVPETDDPRQKINQATYLFNQQNRPVAALNILEQAVILAQRRGDKESEADAEFYLAEILKNPGAGNDKLRNPGEAIQHYNKAIAGYETLKLYKRSAFVSWNASAAYEILKDKKNQCASLIEAERSHQKTGGTANDTLPAPFNNGGLHQSIQHLREAKGCGR